MGYVIIFLTIGFLILIHELGHFIAARSVGIPVKQFSIGYGPKLWGFTRGETEYRISAIPIGGYVMLDIDELDDYFLFSFRGRVIFAFTGPLANVVAAWTGLTIISIITSGFTLHSVFVLPTVQLWEMTIGFIQTIPILFSQPKQLSGIVDLVAFGGEHIGVDMMKLLSMSVLLNINLAFLNLLPILPLDGGKIVCDILHRLRMPVKRIYVPVALTGWILLLGLMLCVTFNDVVRLCA